jgi:hypothetical protein
MAASSHGLADNHSNNNCNRLAFIHSNKQLQQIGVRKKAGKTRSNPAFVSGFRGYPNANLLWTQP